MANGLKGKAASRAALVLVLASGMWTLTSPGDVLATPPMGGGGGGGGGGGCASGCGGGEGHSHKPMSNKEIREALDDAMDKALEGPDETGNGGTSIRSGGRPGEDMSGQIGAAAAAQGASGSDDPSAALTNFANAGANAGKALINAGVAAADDLGTKAAIDNRYKGSDGTMSLLDDATGAAAGNGPANPVAPAPATAKKRDAGLELLTNVAALHTLTDEASGAEEKDRKRQADNDATMRRLRNLNPDPLQSLTQTSPFPPGYIPYSSLPLPTTPPPAIAASDVAPAVPVEQPPAPVAKAAQPPPAPPAAPPPAQPVADDLDGFRSFDRRN